MGQPTIDELLALADDPKKLSRDTLLHLCLAITKENYLQLVVLNGSVKDTIKRLNEVERYPSLISMIKQHPKQTILTILLLFILTHILVDLNMFQRIFDALGLAI